MCASAGPGPSSSSPKQWKPDGSIKIYKSRRGGGSTMQTGATTQLTGALKNYAELKSSIQFVEHAEKNFSLGVPAGRGKARFGAADWLEEFLSPPAASR